ncbi:Transcription factor DP [Rhynchospora pubera]|uniref:Transcription factor DP n=1 Tax=Rhynchospora pubera TaxID=906938 RepID=A0AAV8F055_9POAL|nr:Transcription factor DP [Rhynchospora pubera]KAJ4803175.1 Transcription factor DP [Rhynchospora pubera]
MVVTAAAGTTSGGRASWGTPPISASGAHSASTSGSAGSPPTHSAAPAPPAMTTPASDSTFVRLNNLDIHADEAPASSQATASKKKKRGARAVGPDKGGRGLRQFSMRVCEKVESKGRTTYNEVADELVAEFADPTSSFSSPDQQQYDEKNIRRRVYDALNVLMAMDIISKDKKEIQWKGLPRTSLNDVEELKTELAGLKSRIDKKAAYLQELQDQALGLQNLVQRNEQLYGSGNAPSGGVALPFILVQTRPHATVEVEISEDMQLVHFDFNSTPFELHDDSYVLKAMRTNEREQNGGGSQSEHTSNGAECSNAQNSNAQNSMPYHHSQLPVPIPQPPPQPQPQLQPQKSTRPTNYLGKLPTSPPIPGILKGRVKYEH